jgi:RNA polymerase sigma-70 factor (ECF subfamily)
MDHEEMKEQFLAVYDQYGDAIFRFCQLKVSIRATAEDISQEVFMRYWQQLRLGKEIGNERALLYSIARNLIIDWYRKHKEQSLDVLTEAGFEFAGADHIATVTASEVREVIGVISALDEPTREALTLRFVEGLSPKDIAEITGESANAISVRLNRGIKKVQDHLHIHE